MDSTILIPAYNEEKGIKKTIDSCLMQTKKPKEIIVINDGSTDKTQFILEQYGKKIKLINLKKNTGNKSKAQEIGLKYVKTEIFITTDADTRLDKNFINSIIKKFGNREVCAVCGYVKSERDNWITRVREINYVMSQTIYKKAQTKINALFVLAGCASAFRTEVFRDVVTFEHDNITEDLDFTYEFKIAGKKLDYDEQAIVYTQDPRDLKSYFKQIYRWYSGGWTCLKKNKKILLQPNNALILSLVYLEGLILGGLFLVTPILLILAPKMLLGFFLLEFGLTSLAISYGVIKTKEYHLFLYVPHHCVIHFITEYIFLHTFVKEIILNKTNMVWRKPERY